MSNNIVFSVGSPAKAVLFWIGCFLLTFAWDIGWGLLCDSYGKAFPVVTSITVPVGYLLAPIAVCVSLGFALGYWRSSNDAGMVMAAAAACMVMPPFLLYPVMLFDCFALKACI